MRSSSWMYHTGKFFLVGTAVLFVGWMIGKPVASLAVATIIYGGWHLVNLLRLYRWILNPEREVPESLGLWAAIFNGINSIEKNDRSQQDQQRSEISNLRNLVNALPDALIVTNQDGAITWCNTSALQLLKIEIPKDYGKSLSTLVRDPDLAVWLIDRTNSKQPLDMRSPNEDGRWLTVNEIPLQENQRLFILGNITSIHNVEQMRRDFVANISHELRTPLTVLRGYLELLDDHPSSDVSESVRKMLGQSLQMQTLLDDLLELARLQYDDLQGKDEVVNVPAMLMRLREQANALSQGDHEITFKVDHQLNLAGMSSDLESAFGNLIINAIKYTPKGGRISVTWEQAQEGPYLLVQDSGIGIPRQDIPRVTERFYRVGSDRARQTGGTGLGLSIVKHVLHAHQARLIIVSELAAGSKMTCSFPNERARPGKTA